MRSLPSQTSNVAVLTLTASPKPVVEIPYTFGGGHYLNKTSIVDLAAVLISATLKE